MATLEFEEKGSHKSQELSKKCTTIGRGTDADITFVEDMEMSRRHCSILLQDAENILIRDDGSTNGTYVNDQLIDSAVAIPLKDNDEIHVGTTFLTFHK